MFMEEAISPRDFTSRQHRQQTTLEAERPLVPVSERASQDIQASAMKISICNNSPTNFIRLMKFSRIAVRIFLAGLLMPSLAQAQAIPVTNPGFEDISGETPYNEFTFGPLNGWSLYDPNGITSGGAGATFYIGTLRPTEREPMTNPGVYENFPNGAIEGIRVGIAFNFEGSGGMGEYGFQQTLGATLAANTSYTLQVQIGNIASGFAVDGQFFDLDGFPGYRVDLLAGGLVLSSDNNSLAGTIPEGEWGLSTVGFTTGPTHAQLGQQLGIRLVNLNVVDAAYPDSDLEVDFDAVSLTAVAVPEPDAAALLVAGSLAMLIAACRRRRGSASV
jgi:hypothetical protein